ncbi:uncharacterized protein LOC111338913 isoform X2 [Stylophora pistillata]|uniref:uncharacterized protein LOC111338913 isoform X2 n=1 Tax=Stylophora pistillata TaxID=50429 RepID=UPI000C03DEBC|nr:uncharacterized protein LOC111338913 isoform X2 [Stylophora pistillata]
MDGCFGLCRKMEEGHDLGTPKHGTLLFADQDDVDNFVNSYGKAGADMEQNCSKFHAGEVLSAFRSKGKNKLFDKKGVFGISYSVYELKRLRSLNESTRSRVIIMYDIACLLAHHLKESLLEGVDVAIPIFHCYGHKTSCQIQYSPRRIKGTGLTDGEGVVRLWFFSA